MVDEYCVELNCSFFFFFFRPCGHTVKISDRNTCAQRIKPWKTKQTKQLTKLAASMMPSSTGCVQSRVNFNTCFFFLPPLLGTACLLCKKQTKKSISKRLKHYKSSCHVNGCKLILVCFHVKSLNGTIRLIRLNSPLTPITFHSYYYNHVW